MINSFLTPIGLRTAGFPEGLYGGPEVVVILHYHEDSHRMEGGGARSMKMVIHCRHR